MALTRPSASLRVAETATPPTLPPDLHPSYPIDPLPHMKWARMIARVIRAEFGIARNSEAERDLEAVAYATLCKHALRFDHSLVTADSTPERLLRGSSKRDIKTECRRAARKLLRGGLCMLPDVRPPRCETCTEVIQGLSGDRRRELLADEEEADEPVIVVTVPAPVNVPAPGMRGRSEQNAAIAKLRKKPT